MNININNLIEQLERYKERIQKKISQYDDLLLAGTLAVLEAIKEKEFPSKPNYVADGYSDGELVYDTAVCPRCERIFEIDNEEEYEYCPDCGQRLDWTKEK